MAESEKLNPEKHVDVMYGARVSDDQELDGRTARTLKCPAHLTMCTFKCLYAFETFEVQEETSIN